MADAYGRLTGQAGVCLGTLGPGATNLMTGLADAYLDRAPVVALTGQTGLAEMHKESHQYIDIVRMMKPVTKWNARIHDAGDHPRGGAQGVRGGRAREARGNPPRAARRRHGERGGRLAGAAARPAPGRAGRKRAASRGRAAAGGRAAGDPGRQRRRPPERVGGAAPVLPADRPERDHDLHGQGRRRCRRSARALHRRAAVAGLPDGIHGPGRPDGVRRLRPRGVVAEQLEPEPATAASSASTPSPPRSTSTTSPTSS